MNTYVYEPYWPDPSRELEACLNFYRKLVTKLHIWDLMEFVAYLGYRDGVDWSLKQLGRGNVDLAVLAEIEKLDAKLRANSDYLVNDLELYRHIRRDEPEEYWWWYLDGGKPDGPPEARETIEEMWQVSTEAVPVAMVAEERASYEEQPSNK
ncbi:MAG: hypothetical protein KKC18_02665 [Chloroflexi bacterium]|nr:hypothetical protein [Chloroflexota bacterium]